MYVYVCVYFAYIVSYLYLSGVMATISCLLFLFARCFSSHITSLISIYQVFCSHIMSLVFICQVSWQPYHVSYFSHIMSLVSICQVFWQLYHVYYFYFSDVLATISRRLFLFVRCFASHIMSLVFIWQVFWQPYHVSCFYLSGVLATISCLLFLFVRCFGSHILSLVSICQVFGQPYHVFCFYLSGVLAAISCLLFLFIRCLAAISCLLFLFIRCFGSHIMSLVSICQVFWQPYHGLLLYYQPLALLIIHGAYAWNEQYMLEGSWLRFCLLVNKLVYTTKILWNDSGEGGRLFEVILGELLLIIW